MTRLARLAVAALFAPVALAGCFWSKPVTHEFAIAPGIRPDILAVPRGASPDFAACAGARAFVPYRGGVVVAGWHAWLVEPGAQAIQSVACDEAHVYGVTATELSILAGGAWQHVATLPAGQWQVGSSPDSRVWLWGRLPDGTWTIQQIRPDGPRNVYTGPGPITAAAVDHFGLLVALDRKLVFFDAKGAAHPMIELDAAPDGIAYLDGQIVVSTPGGIFRLSDLKSPPLRIATDLHGTLRARPGALYVRSVEQLAVIRLSPDVR